MSDHGFNNCTSSSNDVSTVNISCSTSTAVDLTGSRRFSSSVESESHSYPQHESRVTWSHPAYDVVAATGTTQGSPVRFLYGINLTRKRPLFL